MLVVRRHPMQALTLTLNLTLTHLSFPRVVAARLRAGPASAHLRVPTHASPALHCIHDCCIPHVLHHVCVHGVGIGMGRFRTEFATGLRQFDKRTCAAVWGGF